jgi:hypothetical protein
MWYEMYIDDIILGRCYEFGSSAGNGECAD